MTFVTILVVAAVVAVVAIVLSRANELFCVSVRSGRCLIVRGHVPPSLWRELRDVMKRARATGTVRAVKSGGTPRLVFSGIDPSTQQRVRNAFGAMGFGHLKASAPAPSSSGGSRNLGQLLGFAWLAWLLAGRR